MIYCLCRVRQQNLATEHGAMLRYLTLAQKLAITPEFTYFFGSFPKVFRKFLRNLTAFAAGREKVLSRSADLADFLTASDVF